MAGFMNCSQWWRSLRSPPSRHRAMRRQSLRRAVKLPITENTPCLLSRTCAPLRWTRSSQRPPKESSNRPLQRFSGRGRPPAAFKGGSLQQHAGRQRLRQRPVCRPSQRPCPARCAGIPRQVGRTTGMLQARQTRSPRRVGRTSGMLQARCSPRGPEVAPPLTRHPPCARRSCARGLERRCSRPAPTAVSRACFGTSCGPGSPSALGASRRETCAGRPWRRWSGPPKTGGSRARSGRCGTTNPTPPCSRTEPIPWEVCGPESSRRISPHLLLRQRQQARRQRQCHSETSSGRRSQFLYGPVKMVCWNPRSEASGSDGQALRMVLA
mmetsp:Transcript_21244/g.67248  ORF Transcript_21244/g.67248 Transcript_21244/m.67248 type:complete len:325 (+) Transcript_21244:810-1784(+)